MSLAAGPAPLYASLESQLGNAPCLVEDTEEMFWLRQLDDYASRVTLGNALAAQYRFKEAVTVYSDAAKIRKDDWLLFCRIGGAKLTLRDFDGAFAAYHESLRLGAPAKDNAFSVGVWHYLQGNYATAAQLFATCLPCKAETAIAAIYWHTLSCYRSGCHPTLLDTYSTLQDVGHHQAYLLAVLVFCGQLSWQQAAAQAEQAPPLDAAILFYGICRHLAFCGKLTESALFLNQALAQKEVWPCISYLAAWADHAKAAM